MDTPLFWRSVVLLLTVMAPLAEAQTQTKAPILCATGTFTEGSLGFIECLFNRNINTTDSRYNFNVMHYRTSNGTTGNHVLLCNWRQGELECKTGESVGYSFDKKVSDRLTVGIDAVSNVHAGMYSCQVLPDDDIPVQTCTLRVKARTTPTSEPAITTSLAPHGTESNSAVIGLVTVLVVCLVVIVTTIVIVLVYYFRREIVDGVSCCKSCREAGQQMVTFFNGAATAVNIAPDNQLNIALLEEHPTPANHVKTQNQSQQTTLSFLDLHERS